MAERLLGQPASGWGTPSWRPRWCLAGAAGIAVAVALATLSGAVSAASVGSRTADASGVCLRSLHRTGIWLVGSGVLTGGSTQQLLGLTANGGLCVSVRLVR